MARLTQRQGQLDRQHRETITRVEILKRDADASKRDVDSRIDSLRREIDWQFRDRDLRVKSLERFRDFIESLIMYGTLIGYAMVIVISVVITIVEARGASQESEQPEGRSLSSMEVPRAADGGQGQPGLRPMRHISVAPVARHASAIDREEQYLTLHLPSQYPVHFVLGPVFHEGWPGQNDPGRPAVCESFVYLLPDALPQSNFGFIQPCVYS